MHLNDIDHIDREMDQAFLKIVWFIQRILLTSGIHKS